MELRPEMRHASRRVIGNSIAALLIISGVISLPESQLANKSDAGTYIAEQKKPTAINSAASNYIFQQLGEVTTTTTTTTTQPQTPAEYAASKVTPLEYYQWSKVNQCEEQGNWHVVGTTPGGLGIKPPNWIHYGGQFFFGDEASATPQEQILVAMAIQPNPPDQDGVCRSW